MHVYSFFRQLQLFTLYVVVFLFPLFFLPLTSEWYMTNKLYLLAVGSLVLILAAAGSLLADKKITFRHYSFSFALFLLIAAYGGSVVFSSSNKVQALIAVPTGLAVVFFLSTVTFFSLQLGARRLWIVLQISALCVSLVVIGNFFKAFVGFPDSWFSPLGTPLETALFLGFFIVSAVYEMLAHIHSRPRKSVVPFLLFCVHFFSLVISVEAIIKTKIFAQLPSYSISWLTVIETLKKPHIAIFGAGIDNFIGVFAQAKNLVYNGTNLWNVNFAFSRSFFLHLWTEAGILGLLVFLLLMVMAVRMMKKIHTGGMIYLVLCLIVFPPSFSVLFLFFIFTSMVVVSNKHDTVHSFNLLHHPLVYLTVVGVFFILAAAMSYFLGRSYLSQLRFKQAIDALSAGKIQMSYGFFQQAIGLNPYRGEYRLQFSRLNLGIVDSLARKKEKDLTDGDKQTITQAIRASLSEAKAAAALHPEDSRNWQNLADIYSQLVSSVQGAEVWAIAAYERAIMVDPVNPGLRLDAGAVYYMRGDFAKAEQLFGQAVSLKPNWPNAHYNRAWALFAKKEYASAAAALKNVLALIDPQSPDGEKVQKELAEFQKKLPQKQEESAATVSSQLKTTESSLTLPSPAPSISPAIALPSGAGL